MAKPKLKIKSRKLRTDGLGIKTIAHQLHVSSSTVSLWCRDIKLSPEQIKELARRNHDPYYGKRLQYIQKQKEKRLRQIDKLKQLGIKEIGKLSKRELFLTGVALYWAEGFKKDARMGFANSDPKMIQFFIKWLLQNCKVPKESIRLRVGLNVSHKNRINEVEKFWSGITGISPKQFQKPFFQNFVWKKDFPNPNEYFGVLRVRVNKQLELFRKIHGWIEGLKHQGVSPEFQNTLELK